MIKIPHELVIEPWYTATSDYTKAYSVYFTVGNEQHDDYVIVLDDLEDIKSPYEFHINDKFKALRELVLLKHEIITKYIQRNNIGFLNA
jgi:hypothetical protein